MLVSCKGVSSCIVYNNMNMTITSIVENILPAHTRRREETAPFVLVVDTAASCALSPYENRYTKQDLQKRHIRACALSLFEYGACRPRLR